MTKKRAVQCFLAGVLCALAGHFIDKAFPEWKPEYAQAPPEVRQWYETRELNPETQKRLNVQWKSCCNHSDVVRTQFKVNNNNGADEWWYLDPNDNVWKKVPPDTVHYGDPAPDNQPTLFAYMGQVTCFFVPNGAS